MRLVLIILAAVATAFASASPAAATVLTFQEGDGGAFSSTAATFLREPVPSTNFGADPELFTDAVSYPSQAGLIAFFGIFGSAPGQIPLGSIINSATLRLTVTDNPSNDTQRLFRVIRAWSEDTVTYGNFGPVAGIDAGSDFDGTQLASFVPSVASTAHDLTITAAVASWSAGAANYGVLVHSSPGTSDGATFASDDNATSSFRPKLTVDFTAVPEPGFVAMLLGSVVAAAAPAARRRVARA